MHTDNKISGQRCKKWQKLKVGKQLELAIYWSEMGVSPAGLLHHAPPQWGSSRSHKEVLVKTLHTHTHIAKEALNQFTAEFFVYSCGEKGGTEGRQNLFSHSICLCKKMSQEWIKMLIQRHASLPCPWKRVNKFIIFPSLLRITHANGAREGCFFMFPTPPFPTFLMATLGQFFSRILFSLCSFFERTR